ncbi:hypothetical protein BDZ89DRAFT_144756 [Hymenopellis radicata]|nr:hypothetical protein BDZ89DRAFT_144756 [Hymenopellis radicata]
MNYQSRYPNVDCIGSTLLSLLYNESRKRGLRLPSNLHLYGAQMTAPLLDFSDIVVGCLSTKTPLRALQLNNFVTSGVVPAGGAHAFQNDFLWMQRSAEAMIQKGGKEGSDLIPITTQSVKYAIDVACDLAITVRVEQWFLDGNHRTALACMVFSLAEQGVILSSTFCLYKAYTIISARFHPGNESNSLDEEARQYARSHLVSYLRKRTRINNSTTALRVYLEHHLHAIRLLPNTVTRIEDLGRELELLASEGAWLERLKVWRAQGDRMRVDMKLTFPALAKGLSKLP